MAVRHASPTSPTRVGSLVEARARPYGGSLPAALQADVLAAFARAIDSTFLVGVPIALAPLVLAFFLPAVPLLRRTHGGDAGGRRRGPPPGTARRQRGLGPRPGRDRRLAWPFTTRGPEVVPRA